MGLKLDYNDGQTPLDPEEREGLLIKTITTHQELDEFEQLNIEKALQKYLFRYKPKQEEILSEKFVFNLHKEMFGDVWRWSGKYRKSNKNIGVDRFHIATQFHQLIDDCKYWIVNKVMEDDEICIQFKHRLVAIHLFSNGNGRHSRLMADIMRKHIFKKPFFTWGKTNLVNEGDVRAAYIKALKEADKGDIKPLLTFSNS
jgi:Fic-DOC domain mobile mystery protein B